MLKRMVVCAIIVADIVVCVGFATAGLYHLDLEVYRFGAQTWLNGGELYGPMPTTAVGLALPFTYPPIAAVFLAPATLLPLSAAGVVVSVLTAGLLLVVIAVAVGALWPAYSRWLLAGAVLPVAMFLEPVRETVSYGQINVLLMALVVIDCLAGKPRLPRGVLVGLAAAVKLTPAAFVLFFLLRKDYRAVRNAGAAFAATTAVGFLLAWPDSMRYWTGTVFDTGRIGTPWFAGNQSLSAVLARFGMETPARTGVWLVGVAVVLGLAVLGMRRALGAGLPVLALGVNALAVLICSPVSWSHHWVWLVPILLAFAALWRSPLFAVTAGVGAVLFMVGPQWSFPETINREYQWNFMQQLVGNLYFYFAVLVLIMVAVLRSWPSRAGIAISESAGHGRPEGGSDEESVTLR